MWIRGLTVSQKNLLVRPQVPERQKKKKEEVASGTPEGCAQASALSRCAPVQCLLLLGLE